MSRQLQQPHMSSRERILAIYHRQCIYRSSNDWFSPNSNDNLALFLISSTARLWGCLSPYLKLLGITFQLHYSNCLTWTGPAIMALLRAICVHGNENSRGRGSGQLEQVVHGISVPQHLVHRHGVFDFIFFLLWGLSRFFFRL